MLCLLQRSIYICALDYKERLVVFMKKEKKDERIQKRSNELLARVFYIMWISNVISLIVKLVYGLPFEMYVIEIGTLVLGVAVWLVEEFRYGSFTFGKKDVMLRELSNKAKMEAVTVMFVANLIGMVLYDKFCDKAYFMWIVSYLLIFFPGALYYTIAVISEGLFIFGTRKKAEKGKKRMVLSTVIAASFFGFLTVVKDYYRDGTFYPKGLLIVLIDAILWGVLFYFSYMGMIKISEKRADKNVEKENAENEKQENENCTSGM